MASGNGVGGVRCKGSTRLVDHSDNVTASAVGETIKVCDVAAKHNLAAAYKVYNWPQATKRCRALLPCAPVGMHRMDLMNKLLVIGGHAC